ncbi:MAG: thiol oxidoreductase [Gammaproteobacteria bacterium]|nr:thiol oxidoreductase [Gammaproteobacteria bacterium]|tara:strand:- start:65 stop:739 length:675 start_codon:yes stop_codon:yes gene_type:complete
MNRNKILIDIVSDIVCPWCAIGYKKLSGAITELGNEITFEVNWKPYELHPEIPKEGFDKKEYYKLKFGESSGSDDRFNFINEEGKKVGIEFNFKKSKNLPNTFLAHRLLWFCRSKDIQDTMAEALFHAYFTEGRDVGNKDELIKISSENGLNMEEIKGFFQTDIGHEEVLREENRAREMNIFSVPTYIFNKKYLLVGGQESDTFKAFIKKVIEVDSKDSKTLNA